MLTPKGIDIKNVFFLRIIHARVKKIAFRFLISQSSFFNHLQKEPYTRWQIVELFCDFCRGQKSKSQGFITFHDGKKSRDDTIQSDIF